MKLVWPVIFRVFRLLNLFVTLPIQYSWRKRRFTVNHTFLIGWKIWSVLVLSYTLIVFYRLFCHVYFPQQNSHLRFALQSVVLYIFEFIVSVQALVSIYVCTSKATLVVTILNQVLHISRLHLKYYPGDRVSIFWLQSDTGAAFASIASVGFLAFPFIGGCLPLLVGDDPGSHLSTYLFPNLSSKSHLIFASLLQGSIAGFAAMPCLQILLVLTAIVVEFGGMMWEASTIRHPWIALLLSERKYVWYKPKRTFTLQNIAKYHVVSQFRLARCALKVMQSRNRSLALAGKWKYAVHRILLFAPSLKLHRQITILNCVLHDALNVYNPSLIMFGMSLIVVCTFFPIRFHPPMVLTILCVTVAVSVTGVTLILMPAGALVGKASRKFTHFWRKYLRLNLNRKQLRSCRRAVIRIGPFCHFHDRTALLVMNIILNGLATLLINV